MAAAGSSGAAREEVEEFSERELEVAAILADLPSIVRACNRRRRQQLKQQQQARPEIPSWGRRRPRKPAAPPAAEKPAGDDDGRNGAASPDTPLAFPEDDEHREAAAAAAAEDEAKACAQHKWAQEQRGVAAASLSHDNAHLLKQIEEFRARLQSSRSTNDGCLSQIHHQSKHKKRHRPEGEEEEARRWRLQPRAAGRPALDLNEPAEADADDGKPPQTSAAAQWFHHQQQHQQLMQLGHKAARRRRQEIRRAKAAASRVRRLG